MVEIYLISTLAANPATLGLIEGIAESVAALFKLFSGLWADRVPYRKPIIVFGYGLSSLARPLIGLTGSWGQVLGLRFLDRVGKGFRTPPRDALVADVTPVNLRGQAYGFHRAMDHWGAVTGPLIATALMLSLGLKAQSVFLWAAVPAFFALVILVFFLDERRAADQVKETTPAINLRREWAQFPRPLKSLLLAVFVFYLGQSSDMFLLLRLKDQGIGVAYLPALWALLHVVKATSSQYLGFISDRMGHQKLIVFGWFYYALIYFGFAFVELASAQVGLFLLYGVYFGLVEAPEKALISLVAPAEAKGGAFGFYHLAVGISSLPASLLFGWVWTEFGATAAFCGGATISLLALLLLPSVLSRK